MTNALKLEMDRNAWPATLLVMALCALAGCGEDSNSTPAMPDLAAVSAQERGCIGIFCGPYRFDICIENRGAVDVGEPFVVTLAGRAVVEVPALAAAERACFVVTNSAFPLNPVMEVDPQGTIPDADRSNNRLNYPQPNPTGCDILCTDPTPTPARVAPS